MGSTENTMKLGLVNNGSQECIKKVKNRQIYTNGQKQDISILIFCLLAFNYTHQCNERIILKKVITTCLTCKTYTT